MSTYMLRDVDAEELLAFRARCHACGLKPEAVLKRMIAEAKLNYLILDDAVHVAAVWKQSMSPTDTPWAV